MNEAKMIKTHLVDQLVQDIPVEEYRVRLQKVRERMKEQNFDLLLVYSNTWRMSNVYWISGYRSFDGITGEAVLLFIPQEGDIVLFGEKKMLGNAKEVSWVTDLRNARTEWAAVLEDYKNSKKPKKVGIIGYSFFALEFWLPIQKTFEGIEIVPCDIFDRLKCIKSENEIGLIKTGCRISDQSMVDLQANIREGMTEREAVQIMHTSLFMHGGDSLAFDIMVQSGVHSGSYPALRGTDKKICKGELILIDTGIRYRNYSADMGRGVAYGDISPEQQHLLDSALAAYREGMKFLKPGLSTTKASDAIDAVLNEAGLGKAHTAGGNRKCGHGTGNDPEEEYPVMGRADHILENNMLIAYELTVQTPELGGCRCEDVVVIREGGPEFLTNYPRNIHWD
jgi:Xaa-Pro aminopeptidase